MNENIHLYWIVRLTLTLAIKEFKEKKATGAWEGAQKWNELVVMSQNLFVKMALEEAGIKYEDYVNAIENGIKQDQELEELLDATWKNFEQKEEKGE